MAELTPNVPSRTGTAPTSNSVSSEDTIPNTGKQYVRIQNDNAGTTTASFVITATVDGITPATKDVEVAAGAVAYVGPFPTSIYSETLTIQFDVTSSVTMEVFTVA
jgi:hypothetical protein